MTLAVDTFKRMRQQVTLINLPEFDWPLGHVDGGIIAPEQATILMQGFDRDLAMLQDAYRKAGVLDRTVFVLMADHGMMPLRHTLDKSIFTNAVTRAGTSVVTDAYSSAAYLWLKDSSKAGRAGQILAAERNPAIQSIYARTRTARGQEYVLISHPGARRAAGLETANQYLLRTFNGPNAPDLVAAFTEGVGCEPGGQASWKGDHGGTSWQAQHLPLFISGPGIRSAHVSSAPARLIDVAPTILEAMGVPHTRMPGTVLADAFLTPRTGLVKAQQATAKGLMPVVAALQQQSRLEGAR
jgi:arylsulfatase A-like enzyme